MPRIGLYCSIETIEAVCLRATRNRSKSATSMSLRTRGPALLFRQRQSLAECDRFESPGEAGPTEEYQRRRDSRAIESRGALDREKILSRDQRRCRKLVYHGSYQWSNRRTGKRLFLPTSTFRGESGKIPIRIWALTNPFGSAITSLFLTNLPRETCWEMCAFEAVESFAGRAVSVSVDQPVYGVSIEPAGIGNGDDSYLNDTTVFNDELGSDFIIQGSTFRNSRRFGIYLMSRRGQIVDSVFEGISDQAIAGHNETRWPLGLFPDDILIQNNVFSNIGFSGPYQRDPQFTAAVAFNMDRRAENVLVDAAERPIRNIRLLDNEFRDWRKSAIGIRNAVGVTIEDNRFYSAMTHDATDADNAGQNHAIRIDVSKDVEVVGNIAIDLGSNEGFAETLLEVEQGAVEVVEFNNRSISAWISWTSG